LRATLLGVCRLFNNPPCNHLAIERFLVWTKGRDYSNREIQQADAAEHRAGQRQPEHRDAAAH